MLLASEICSGCGGASKWAYCDDCLDFMKRVLEASAAPPPKPVSAKPAMMFPVSDGVPVRRTRTTAGSNKRAAVYERDGRKCYWCLKPLFFKDATVDHLVARSLGGGHELENLVCSCSKCNGDKGSMELIEWVARIGRTAPVVIERVVTTTERITITVPTAEPTKKKKAKKSGRIKPAKRTGFRFAGKGCMSAKAKAQQMAERGLKFVE